MLLKAVLPVTAATVVLASSVFATEEQTSASMAAADAYVADAYVLKVGDNLKYESNYKVLTYGAPKEQQVKATSEFIVLSVSDKANTLFGKVTLTLPADLKGDSDAPSFPFTFELLKNGEIGQTNGVYQSVPGSPAGLFLPIPKKEASALAVPFPQGLDLQLPVALAEKDGARVFTMELKEPKTVRESETINKYKLEYAYKDSLLSSISLNLSTKLTSPKGDQTVTSTMEAKAVLLSKGTMAAEDLEKLQKDVTAGIETWNSLQSLATQGNPDAAVFDAIIAKFDKYLADYPTGNFAQAIKEISTQLKKAQDKMKAAKDAEAAKPADEQTTAAK